MICRPMMISSLSMPLLVSIVLVIGLVRLFPLVALIARVGSERTGDAHHIGHAPDDTDDASEMLAIAHSQLECQYDRVAAMLFDGDTVDVGFEIRDRGRDGGQHSGA